MSASTVSLTANPATARRRPVVAGEKKTGLDLLGAEAVAASGGGGGDKETVGGSTRDFSHSVRGETVLEKSREPVSIKKLPVATTANGFPRRSTARKGTVSKPEKPLWQTVASVFAKNMLLLLVLVGLVQMVRRLVQNSTAGNASNFSSGVSDFEDRIAEMEAFLKTTTKMMQVQVEVVDKKIEKEVGGLRRELEEKIEDKGTEIANELKNIGDRTGNLEKYVGELQANNWLKKEEFDRFYEEFIQAKGLGDGNNLNLDEVRAFAKEIVEKELEKHAADGLGRVDYALASAGAVVVKHSEPYIVGKGSGSWFPTINRNRVHSDSEKMLRPSFGEPGQCFPLRGSGGFVQIKLRTTIVPEAVTLEHVAKSVAYDRSSAPKHCRISGWLEGHHDTTNLAADTGKMFLLTEFNYDLDKSNAQTFSVVHTAGSGIVNMIRLDFTSNHGSPHTCIYRLRVHGREPKSVSTLPLQS